MTPAEIRKQKLNIQPMYDMSDRVMRILEYNASLENAAQLAELNQNLREFVEACTEVGESEEER